MPKDVKESVEATEAENQEAENHSTQDKSTDSDNKDDVSDDGEIDSDKALQKLKARVGKEQAEKHGIMKELEKAKAEIENLKSQKSFKQMSDADKNKKMLADKDQKIADLEAKIRHRDAVAEVDQVFKESGLNVGDQILNMVTTDDSDITYENAKAIIDLINSTRESAKKDFLKGTPPKVNDGKSPKITKKSLSQMSVIEIAQLKKNDPDKYAEMARKSGWKK